ncbi:MAG: sugar phosphate nucleotidyltransferase [Bacillota bacterium]|nr:sugar phosphate nucleotidyltransferase [Bacillota bacterium]
MKGVVLAGGTGSRLYPLTKAVNKHLLPVGRFPMIYYPLYRLRECGITDVLIVTGRADLGDFVRLLGSGLEFGMSLTYKVQEQAGGISDALSLAECFCGHDKTIVILGDNICEDPLVPFANAFRQQQSGARILLKEFSGPEKHQMAVAEIERGKIHSIYEKPKYTNSDMCVTGIYMYDHLVFDLIRTLKPSARGELEITDVNSLYLSKGLLHYDILPGWWEDAGTIPAMTKINRILSESPQLVAGMEKVYLQRQDHSL